MIWSLLQKLYLHEVVSFRRSSHINEGNTNSSQQCLIIVSLLSAVGNMKAKGLPIPQYCSIIRLCEHKSPHHISTSSSRQQAPLSTMCTEGTTHLTVTEGFTKRDRVSISPPATCAHLTAEAQAIITQKLLLGTLQSESLMHELEGIFSSLSNCHLVTELALISCLAAEHGHSHLLVLGLEAFMNFDIHETRRITCKITGRFRGINTSTRAWPPYHHDNAVTLPKPS